MKTLVVKTQTEFDAIGECKEHTIIEIKSDPGLWIIVRKVPANSHVVAWGSSHVVAWGSSHVEAWGSSHVEAWGSSHVVARESSHVEARESSHVVARESSHVEAWGSSHVEAWGSSHVVARESSHVVARESSHVEARGSSHVSGLESAVIAVWALAVVIEKLKHAAVLILEDGVKSRLPKRDKGTTVIRRNKFLHTVKTFSEICEAGDSKGTVTLYKSVNKETGCDFQTGKIKYEGTVVCPDWNPDPNKECGGGLHLSPTPGAALYYHSQGKLLKCEVKLKDIVVYAPCVTKVRCREVKVLGPL